MVDGNPKADKSSSSNVRMDERRRMAAELGRRGGKKGGKARAQNLSPERRKEIARKAAATRWAKKLQTTPEPTAASWSATPSCIARGTLTFARGPAECYLLDDDRRLLGLSSVVALFNFASLQQLQEVWGRLLDKGGQAEEIFRQPGMWQMLNGMTAESFLKFCHALARDDQQPEQAAIAVDLLGEMALEGLLPQIDASIHPVDHLSIRS